jgi:predicted transcriptional regulator
MNNYNSRFPTISFRIDNMIKKKLEREAEKKEITSTALAQEIIRNFFIDSSAKNKQDLDQELQKARLEKIKVETKYLQLKNDYFENFKVPLSDSGTRILARRVKHSTLLTDVKQIQEQPESPYDELNNRLFCTTCGQLYTWINQTGFIDQIAEFTNHQKIAHNRELNALEKDVINELTFTGESK